MREVLELALLFLVLDIFGVIVFAISGAMTAARKQMDIFGFVLIATVTGLGGGTLRDLVLSSKPVLWVREPIYVLLCVGTGVVTYFVAPFVRSRLAVLTWADAIGLSAFAVIGTQAALEAGATPAIAAVMGMVSATFGGIVRDVICNEYPLLLEPEIYATAALAGAVAFLLVRLTGDTSAAAMIGFLVCFATRAAALIFGLRFPRYKPRPPRPRPGEKPPEDDPGS